MTKPTKKNIWLCLMLAILVVGPLRGECRAANDNGNVGVPSQANAQTDQETQSYWTQERMRLA